MTSLHPCVAALVCSAPLIAHAQDAPAPPDPAAELREKLTKVLHVEPFVDKDKTVSLSYVLTERKEAADWKSKGFDKCEVNTVHVKGRDKVTGLEVGAGSRSPGRALQRLTWTGDFELKLRVQVLVSPQSASFCLLLGKKVGVLWGQRLVKPSGFKPLTKEGKLDRTVYKEGRVVELHVVRKETKLTIKCDGLRTDEREFRRGELDRIQIGFMAFNTRLVISNWTFKGQVVEKKIK